MSNPDQISSLTSNDLIDERNTYECIFIHLYENQTHAFFANYKQKRILRNVG